MSRVRVLPGSVAWNVIEFFKAAPDEELLTEDIRSKFAANASRVPQLLEGAVERGLLARRMEPRGGAKGGVRFVYMAGPALLAELEGAE